MCTKLSDQTSDLSITTQMRQWHSEISHIHRLTRRHTPAATTYNLLSLTRQAHLVTCPAENTPESERESKRREEETNREERRRKQSERKKEKERDHRFTQRKQRDVKTDRELPLGSAQHASLRQGKIGEHSPERVRHGPEAPHTWLSLTPTQTDWVPRASL